MKISLTRGSSRSAMIVAACGLLVLAGCARPIGLGTGSGAGATATAASAPAPAPTRQPSAKERLVTAIEANDCVLTADNVGAVIARASVSNAEMGSLVSELEAEGRAEVAGSGAIRILSDMCI